MIGPNIKIPNVVRSAATASRVVKTLPETNIGPTYFTINWLPYNNAYYYEIDLSTASDFSSFVYEALEVVVNNNNYSYQFRNLDPNKTYYYRVRAIVDYQFGNFYNNYKLESTYYSEVNTTSNTRSDVFKDFSLLGYPTTFGENILATQFPKDGSGWLGFVRGTEGSRITPSGKMGIVPWNKVENSNAFLTWNANINITKTPGAIANPLDGNMDGWKVEATSNGFFSFYSSLPPNYSIQGYSQTESIFVKAGTCYVLALRDGQVTAQEVKFNIANGTVISSNIGNRWKIEDYGDGWYRISKNARGINVGMRLEFFGDELSGPCVPGQFCYIYGYQWAESPSYDPLPYLQTNYRLNVPRIDWAKNQPGLLMEGQRTNVLTYSQDFSVTGTGAWQYYQAAANGQWANCAIAPDGTQTASRLRSVGGWYVAGIHQPLPSSADPYVLSIYLKYDQAQYLAFNSAPLTGVAGTNIAACFDIKNGFVVSVDSKYYAYMEEAEDGWYRCVMGIISAANNPSDFWIFPCTSPTNMLSPGLMTYIWGAQVEVVKNANSRSYASTYIRTFASSGTRTGELNIADVSELIGQTEGSVFVDFIYKRNKINSVVEIVKTITTWFDDSILVYCNPPGRLEVEIYRNTFLPVNIISSFDIEDNTRVKMVLTYKQNDYRLYINGILAGTDTSGDPPLELNFVRFLPNLFGSTFDAETPLSKLFSYGLAKRALTNAEAIEITKPYVDPAFDSDYKAILEQAISLGFDLPSEEQRVLQNQLVVDLKANSIWGELDALYVLASDSASNFSRINWKSPTLYLGTIVNDIQKNENSYMINGTAVTDAYLETNFNLSTHSSKYTATSCSMICFVPYFLRTGGISGFIGANDAANNRIALIGSDIAATNAFKAHLNGPNSGVQGYTTIVGAEWFHANKAASNDNAFFQDTSVSYSNNPSTANLPNATVRLMNVSSFPTGRNAVSMGAWGANLFNKNDAFRNIWLKYYNSINLL